MSYKTKFVAALIVLPAMAIIASWQLFLSVVTRDSTAVVGSSHLWLALGAGISAFITSLLMLRFFGFHEKMRWSKVKLTPTEPLVAALGGNPLIKVPAPVPFARKRRVLANPWLSEGQPDDRKPMDGSVKDSGETSSGQRAFARRTHQLMFKKWSKERHD
jgi:hypothetical protein